jgi:hypothetical protein
MATKYVVRVRGVEKLKSKRHDLEMWFYGLLLFSVFPVGIITLVWMFPTEASMKQTFGSHGVSILLSMVIGCTMYFPTWILYLNQALEERRLNKLIGWESIKGTRKFVLCCLPIVLHAMIASGVVALMGWCVYHMIKSLIVNSPVIAKKLVKTAKSVFQFGVDCCKFAGQFVWKLFKLVHSNERLLCLVDASIGAAIGRFYFENTFAVGKYLILKALLGLVAGGIWGLVNYEIVSKRILHLVPATKRD